MSESVLLTDDHPVDPDDELLVAYLDNELLEEERQSVEKRLVAEPDFRQRLQLLQTGWDWLDEIPGESIDEKLVESTIELVVSDIAPGQSEQANWFTQNRRLIITVVAITIAFLVGLVATNYVRRVALERQFDDLAVAQELEAYSLGPDFKFFNELATNPRWQAMASAIEQINERSMQPERTVESLPRESITSALQSLPSDQREKLLVKWKRFQEYDEPTKHELRQTATKVNAREERDSLVKTMKIASVWLEGLSDEMRDSVRSEDASIRKPAIEEAIQYTMAELSFESGKLISETTSEQIFSWLEVLFLKRVDELPPELSRHIQKTLSSGSNNPEIFKMFAMYQMLDDPEQRGRRRFGFRSFPMGFRPGPPPPDGPPPGPPKERDGKGLGKGNDDGPRNDHRVDSDAQRGDSDRGGRSGPQRLRSVTNEEYDELRSVLDDEALRTLDALTSYSTQFAGEAAVYATLRTWARESVERHIAALRNRDEKTALERYQQYDDERRFGVNRDTLDLQPPSEIRDEIFNRRRHDSRR
ncbi:hypothetical protein U8335_21585 [Roseiconus lacunae]|uniref:anti-sigma factor family protein n=1 Tax=Roseiconus lacunae TaxID=2605694 RepID=UPI003085F80F|nr:hypothetical protein U8335_21585 [Stieleria sp. HD01]